MSVNLYLQLIASLPVSYQRSPKFLCRPNSFTLITANRVMNFIADSPEDVNGWVEGMELHVLRFSKTCSVAPVSLLVKLASSSSPPTF